MLHWGLEQYYYVLIVTVINSLSWRNVERTDFIKCLHCFSQRPPCPPDYLHNEEVNKLKFKVHIQPLLFFFYYFQPQPTCLAVVCVRAEPQPWPATCSRKRSCWWAWLCCSRRGLPRLWPWPDDGSGLWKGPSCSIMTACKFLISPTNTLETPTQRLFPDLRSISPTGEFLPAAYVLWRAILWWLDIFHSRPALKQQNRQGNKPWPLSGAALFWFDFFFFLL